MEIQLHPLDWAVIAVYSVGIVAVGLYVARRVKQTSDYFLGRRGFNVWLIIGQAFGVGTHAEMPVSLAGAVYQSGYSAIWYQWKNLFITPFYWILGPMFRRVGRTTIGEVYEDRYGNFMGGVYTIFALAFFTFSMGAMLKGAGKLVSAASGGTVSPNTVVLVMTVTFLLYSFVGGLVAAAYTDFVQSFFIIALSFLLIPLGLSRVGGFSGIRETLDPAMLSMVTPGMSASSPSSCSRSTDSSASSRSRTCSRPSAPARTSEAAASAWPTGTSSSVSAPSAGRSWD